MMNTYMYINNYNIYVHKYGQLIWSSYTCIHVCTRMKLVVHETQYTTTVNLICTDDMEDIYV